MALFIGEEEVWKCPKHPSKRRRNTTGICPTCLRDRLGTLCPNCATLRPCSCSATATSSSTSSSSSSSTSSSFSLFSSFSSSRRITAPVDSTGDVAENQLLRRSRSLAVPWSRSRRGDFPGDEKAKTTSFWGSFRSNRSRKGEKDEMVKDSDEENCDYSSKIGEFEKMMMKSRSMRAPITSKGTFWNFPSTIKVFRQRSKVVQAHSPLQRF